MRSLEFLTPNNASLEVLSSLYQMGNTNSSKKNEMEGSVTDERVDKRPRLKSNERVEVDEVEDDDNSEQYEDEDGGGTEEDGGG